MPSITIDPAIQADIEKFEVQLERYLSGEEWIDTDGNGSAAGKNMASGFCHRARSS